MYRFATETDDQLIVSTESDPDLRVKDRFWVVLTTLPDNCAIPRQLILFGFLSRQFECDNIETQISGEAVRSANRVKVTRETLIAIRWFLSEPPEALSDLAKEWIGELCDATDLNRPPEEGDPPEKVREAAPETYDGSVDFIKESESDSDDVDPLASGKEVKKEGKGGERISGKNPFADPSRIKDTGLHQGGG